MGSQLRWLERTPDKREVDGSSPFVPTNTSEKKDKAQSERPSKNHRTDRKGEYDGEQFFEN